MGLTESLHDYYPEAHWQRCTVHFYRNVFSHVPNAKVKEVARMLKAIHAQESLASARNKAADIVAQLKQMRMGKAAGLVEEAIEQTLTYYTDCRPDELFNHVELDPPAVNGEARRD